MSELLQSFLPSTALLGVALGVGIALTGMRSPLRGEPAELDALRRLAAVVIALQCVHFTEEFLTGFDRRLPELLGLAPWPGWIFVPFNVLWIGIWVVSAAALREGARGLLVPLWFLGLAMVGNAVAHPMLSLRAGGYFPGLVTSPVVGVAGFALCSRLARGTRRR